MEDAIDEHLVVNGVQADLIGTFRESRVKMAQINAVQHRMNPGTGHVDMVALGKDLAKNQKGEGGVPLTGELKALAEYAQVAPKSFQLPEKVGPVTGFSKLDLLGAVASGNWKGAAVLATGSPIRSFITSKHYNTNSGSAMTVAKQIDKTMKATAKKRGTLAALTAGEIASVQGWTDQRALENAQ